MYAAALAFITLYAGLGFALMLFVSVDSLGSKNKAIRKAGWAITAFMAMSIMSIAVGLLSQ